MNREEKSRGGIEVIAGSALLHYNGHLMPCRSGRCVLKKYFCNCAVCGKLDQYHYTIGTGNEKRD